METRKQASTTQQTHTPSGRPIRICRSGVSMNEKYLLKQAAKLQTIMYNSITNPKPKKKIDKDDVPQSPSKRARKIPETPKSVTFRGQKTPRKKSELSEPETPRSFNSARPATRSRSISEIESKKLDFESKSPEKSSTRSCQSARAPVRSRSLSRAAFDEPRTPKRSAREVRSSISSEDEKPIQISISTRNKTSTESQTLAEDLINTPRRTRKQTRMCYNEDIEQITIDGSPTKTPKKAPLTSQNTGLTPALQSLKVSIRKRDDGNLYEIVKKDCDNNFVDQNDENSDVDFVLEKKGRKTPKSAKKKNEPRTPSSVKRKLNVDGATPKRLSLRRNLLLTPSMKERTLPVLKAATPLQEARKRLHVSAVPKSLPCREEEFNNIFSFLRSKILDESSGCMYISGVPGTGKTATVDETVRGLRKLVEQGEIDNFDYVSVNGMKLSEPRQAYVQILKQLEGKSLTWEQAQRALEKRFKGKSNRQMTLLLVDELDMLCTKRQDVVYNLLDWPANVNARLVVVTIANTMDLPEKILKKRVNSRLGMTRLTFEPYNFLQLQQIVLSRLKTLKSFEPEAVEFIARKVASVSGDARRALDICRRATEIAETRDREVVSMKDVREAIAEMINNPKIQAIKSCRKFELLFLRAVTNEILHSGVEETRFDKVYVQLENICRLEGLKVPNVTIAMGICARLGSSRLLVTEHSRADIYQKILLNVTPDDVQFATKEDFSD